MDTRASGAKSWLSIRGQMLFFGPHEDNQRFAIQEYGKYTIRITSYAPDDLTLLIDGEEIEREHNGGWVFNPSHFAGLYQLSARAPDLSEQEFWIRVFPHKFTQKAYEKMKEELSQTAIDLLFYLNSPALEKVNYTPRRQETSALHDYKQISVIIAEMRDVMLRIRREPYQTLQRVYTQQNLREIIHHSREMTPVAGNRVQLTTTPGRPLPASLLPEQWMTPQYHLSYDNYENRLLKHFIHKQLITKLSIIQKSAQEEKKIIEESYTRYKNAEDLQLIQKLAGVSAKCAEMKLRCLYWSSELFLQTVHPLTITGKATQVLQKNPLYSRFYRLYLQFQQRLQTTIETDTYITMIATRKVSALYELWSVFGLTKVIIDILLAAGYQMLANTTFEITENLFHFDVRKNVASIILKKDAVQIEIKYEPIYPKISQVHNRSAIVADTFGTYALTPDMALEVYQQDTPQTVFIFDAKYRWQADRSGTFRPKAEDIKTMNDYFNTIRYQEYQPGKAHPEPTRPIVHSAYIIYPGNNIHTQMNGQIGAFPFFPYISERRIEDIRAQLKYLLANWLSTPST